MDSIEAAFEGLIGKMAWNIRQTHGSMFFVEFGDPHIETHGPLIKAGEAVEGQILRRKKRLVFLHGEWTLLVEDCNWYVWAWEFSADQDTAPVDMNIPFEAASGQYLKSVSYNSIDKSCIFDFDLGAQIKTFPRENPNPFDEQWTLSGENGIYISLLNNGVLSRRSGDGRPI